MNILGVSEGQEPLLYGRWLVGLMIVVGMGSGTLPTNTVQAAGFKSPQECLAYEGDAHLNCLYAYIEIQKGKISKLEEELKGIKTTTQQLKEEVNRQSAVTRELQRESYNRNQEHQYAYAPGFYPSLGFSFHFGKGHHFGPYGYRYRFFSPTYGPFHPYW